MTDAQATAADMGHPCDYCKGRSFRRSRLQSKDWLGLLQMRYPVRCLTCSQRQSVGMSVALRSVPSSVKQVRKARHTGTWIGQVNAQVESHQAGQPIGGGTFPELRGGQQVAMPDLHGVHLQHHTPVQQDSEHVAS